MKNFFTSFCKHWKQGLQFPLDLASIVNQSQEENSLFPNDYSDYRGKINIDKLEEAEAGFIYLIIISIFLSSLSFIFTGPPGSLVDSTLSFLLLMSIFPLINIYFSFFALVNLRRKIKAQENNCLINVLPVTSDDLEVKIESLKSCDFLPNTESIVISSEWLIDVQYSSIENLRYVIYANESYEKMKPTINIGDVVLIDIGNKECPAGEDAIYLLTSILIEKAVIHRIYRYKNMDFKLEYDNKLFDPIILHRDDPINIIGKVIGVVSCNSALKEVKRKFFGWTLS